MTTRTTIFISFQIANFTIFNGRGNVVIVFSNLKKSLSKSKIHYYYFIRQICQLGFSKMTTFVAAIFRHSSLPSSITNHQYHLKLVLVLNFFSLLLVFKGPIMFWVPNLKIPKSHELKARMSSFHHEGLKNPTIFRHWSLILS